MRVSFAIFSWAARGGGESWEEAVIRGELGEVDPLLAARRLRAQHGHSGGELIAVELTTIAMAGSRLAQVFSTVGSE